MKELISENCKALAELISTNEFQNLIYVSFAVISFFFAVFLFKTISIFGKSRRFASKLSFDANHPEKLIYLLEKLNLRDKTLIFKSNKLAAFCYGLKSPKIYLSSSMANLANEQEIEAVLRHEQYHLLRKDTIVVFLTHLIHSMFGFLPGFSRIIQNIHVQREIKADIFAVKYLGDKRPLLSVIKKILEEPKGNFAFIPSVSNYDILEPRIYALTREDFKYKRINMVQVTFSILMLILMWIAVLMPVFAHETYSESTSAKLLCPNLEEQNASYPYTPGVNL